MNFTNTTNPWSDGAAYTANDANNGPNPTSPSASGENYTFVSKNREIEIATRNIIIRLGKMFQQTKNWFFNQFYGNQPSQTWHPSAKLLNMIKKTIRYNQKIAFYEKFNQTLEWAKNQWNDPIKMQLFNQVKDYLNLPTLEEHHKKEEWEKINRQLEAGLSANAYQQLLSMLGMIKKRNIQQVAPSVSTKQYLANSSEAKWDKIGLCIFENNGLLIGATTNETDVTDSNQQKVLLFSLNSSVFQRMDALSSNISTQMPPRQGQNNIGIACGDRYFHIITEDPLQGIFHTAIQNETLVIPQYIALSYATFNITSKGYAPKPIKLLDNGCAFAPAYASQYYFSYTNKTGHFDSLGRMMDSFSTQKPFPVETLSFVEGTSCILENIGNKSTLNVRDFDQYFAPLTQKMIQFNFDNANQNIMNQFYGAKTPMLDTMPITLIAPAFNYTTSALITSLPFYGSILSNRTLEPNSGIGVGGIMSLAHCLDLSDIYVYARDAFDTMHNYVIMYDVVNASLDNQSIIGEEQTYSNFNLTSPAQPQIGCFSNGTVMIAYLENGRPAFFTFNFLDLSANSATPTPNPPPTPAPTISSPNSPFNVTVEVTIPLGLNQTFTPITTQMITFSNNTATIEITDKNGYKIVYTINSSDVPLFTKFNSNEIYNFSIAKGNASDGSAPIFVGCNLDGDCAQSKDKSPLSAAFTTNGVNLALVLPLAILGVAAICIPGGIWYVKVERPRSKQRVADYDWSVKNHGSS